MIPGHPGAALPPWLALPVMAFLLSGCLPDSTQGSSRTREPQVIHCGREIPPFTIPAGRAMPSHIASKVCACVSSRVGEVDTAIPTAVAGRTARKEPVGRVTPPGPRLDSAIRDCSGE